MKSFFSFFFSAMLIAFAGVSLVSCGDDENPAEGGDNGGNGDKVVEASSSNVFTKELPKAAPALGLSNFKYNEKGQLLSLETEDGTVTFTYSDAKAKSRAASSAASAAKPIVVMTLPNGYGTFTMEIGENGFAETAVQEYVRETGSANRETWKFRYNEDGQVTYMFRSEGDNEETVIEYKDGNIVKVKQLSDNGKTEDYSVDIVYTSATVANMLTNDYNILLFDYCFRIDLDEMEYMYYAGLLGKATKNLPLGYSEKTRYGVETCAFTWTFGNDNKPTNIHFDSEYTEDGKTYKESRDKAL